MFRKIIVCLPLTRFLLTVAEAQQPKESFSDRVSRGGRCSS
jgi:hypothetical protein